LPSSSLSGVSSLILFPLFATRVNDTGGKFAAGVVDTGGNLPPASLTPAANLPPVSLTPVANLPPVSTTQGELVANLLPVSLIPAAICHRCQLHRWCILTCEYLREFSKKFEMILMLLSGAWGKVIHEKDLKQKSRDTVPLSYSPMRLQE
jgi:hypothetical protein